MLTSIQMAAPRAKYLENDNTSKSQSPRRLDILHPVGLRKVFVIYFCSGQPRCPDVLLLVLGTDACVAATVRNNARDAFGRYAKSEIK
jgi:hypothetical protein